MRHISTATKVVALAVINALGASVGRAQDLSSTPIVFKEKSYVALGTPTEKNLLFEARPAGHFYFWNRLGDNVWLKNGGFNLTSSVSFLPEIRMSTDRSAPVRTPGYRIRANADFLYLIRGDEPSRLSFDLFDLSLTGFGHYSNGQSGCRYRGYLYAAVAPGSADSVCAVVDAAVAAKQQHNYDSGDFSTSYFAASINWRHGFLAGSGDSVRRQVTITLEHQVYPLGLRPGGIDRDLRRDYGQQQTSIAADLECRTADKARGQGVARIAVLGVARFGDESKPLFRGKIESAYVFDNLHDFGLFARLNAGYDYYNIHFYDRKPFYSIGIMWDPNRLERYTTKPVNGTNPGPIRADHCF